CSDSDTTVYDPDGIDLELLKHVKEVERARLSVYADRRPRVTMAPSDAIWNIPCDVAVPSATQNELSGRDAKALVANGCIAVAEGANMPCTGDAVRVFHEAAVAFGPGK